MAMLELAKRSNLKKKESIVPLIPIARRDYIA
jgi:hypothetical protein